MLGKVKLKESRMVRRPMQWLGIRLITQLTASHRRPRVIREILEDFL